MTETIKFCLYHPSVHSLWLSKVLSSILPAALVLRCLSEASFSFISSGWIEWWNGKHMSHECVTLFSPVMPWQPWLINDKCYCIILPWETSRLRYIHCNLSHNVSSHQLVSAWRELNHRTWLQARICLWMCHKLCSKVSCSLACNMPKKNNTRLSNLPFSTSVCIISFMTVPVWSSAV